MTAPNAVLVGLELVTMSIWVGSIACLILVTRCARCSLDPHAQVAFLSCLGRRYGILGTTSLLAAIGIGLTMIWPPSGWGALEDSAVALSGLLVVATALGMAQARAMSALRRKGAANPDDTGLARRIRRGGLFAVALRSLLGLASLSVLAVIARLVGS